jgi:hypothetical protein
VSDSQSPAVMVMQNSRDVASRWCFYRFDSDMQATAIKPKRMPNLEPIVWGTLSVQLLTSPGKQRAPNSWRTCWFLQRNQMWSEPDSEAELRKTAGVEHLMRLTGR